MNIFAPKCRGKYEMIKVDQLDFVKHSCAHATYCYDTATHTLLYFALFLNLFP